LGDQIGCAHSDGSDYPQWAWGILPFTKGKNGNLEVTAPPLPGLAIAGDYLLFVVTKGGVPSEGRHVRLKLKDEPEEELD
jgi:hypothetical protein